MSGKVELCVFRPFSFEKGRSFQSQPRLCGKWKSAGYADFQARWKSPFFGLFHGAAFPQPFAAPVEFSQFGSIPDPSALVDRGRRSVVQTLMQPLMVVELKVTVDARSCF
jgi:hypothetical protein